MTPVDITRLLNALDDTTDQDLIESTGRLRNELGALRKTVGVMEAEIVRRMKDKGATRMRAGWWEVAESVARNYRWDVNQLTTALQRLNINASDYVVDIEVPARVEHKVATTSLLALAKSLGDDGDAIMYAAMIEESAPSLKFRETK